MPMLEISGLSLGADSRNELVKKVSLRVEKGEVHGLIGESGSGKSLTALSVARLLPPPVRITGGTITLNLNGAMQEVSSWPDKGVRKIRGVSVGYVFQDVMTSLNPSMRCGKQIEEVLSEHTHKSRKEIRDEVLSVLTKVKLGNPEKIYSAYPHEISGGQRQRVVIAMAVACKPSLLIADEPTTALDVTVQKRIIELLNELRKSENLAVLFISHDITVISSIANRISVMYRGEIVESGPASAVVNSPSHPYTRGLLACRPGPGSKLSRLPTLEGVMEGKTVVQDRVVKSTDGKTGEILISARGIEKHFILGRSLTGKANRTMHVLRNLNFDIMRGECLGLIGESGSGKSTLGRTILMLTGMDSGRMTYNGEDFKEIRYNMAAFRRRVQLVFQDPYSSLNPKLTAGSAIIEVLKVHGRGGKGQEREEFATGLMEKTGLKKSDLQKYPHQFSGGQRQRLVIARALAAGPEFIVLDEAVSALDVSVRATILNLLADLKDEYNLTYLFISHDMAVVRHFCDRILVMKEGEIVDSGETENVFRNSRHAFTRELIAAS